MLDTLGMVRVALQEVDDGVALLRRAIAIAHETGDGDSLTTAYSNLADMLGMAGRTQEALATAREGLALTSRHFVRGVQWICLTVSELAFDAGELGQARELLSCSAPERLAAPAHLPPAARGRLALGTGDEELTARSRSRSTTSSGVVGAAWIGLTGRWPASWRRAGTTSTALAARWRTRLIGWSCAPTT